MRARSVVFVTVLVIGSVALLGAQASPQPKATPATSNAATTSNAANQKNSLTIEELYLSQEVEVQLLRNQAFSNSRDTKALAIQDIRSGVEAGKYSSDSKEVLAILDALAGEGVYRLTVNNGEVSNNFPDIRRDSVALLGKIGGKNAQDTIVRVLQNDKEPMVQAEAVYALGSMGIGKDALPYITSALHNNSSKAVPDQNLAFASLLAVEKISASQKGISDPEVINSVLDVIYGRYQRNVVQKALAVLKTMRGS